MTLDFNGFKEMVEAVHGVTVCIPEDIDDSEHGITFEAGTQELDGQQALDYVRERSSTPNADIGRMKRQQAFIASMINKVVSAGTLTRPNRVYSFLKAATGSMVTDPGPRLAEQAGQPGLPVPQDRPGQHHLHHGAVRGVPARPQPADVVGLGGQGLWKVLLNDKPLPKKYKEDVISADEPPGYAVRLGRRARARRPARSPSVRPRGRPRPAPAASRRPTPTASAPELA